MVIPQRPLRGAVPLRDIPLDYPVYVERGICCALGDVVREHAPAHRLVMIADATVAALHGDSLRAAFGGAHLDFITVAPGEAEKSRERWAQLTDRLFELECGRDTTIIAVGGGVVCDLAGFVAATYMRGIQVVQVPTTLLSMVDASVGGKTGVDTPHGKNLVGAFHDPCAVVMDVGLLATLPQSVFRSGLAEIIKHGIVADASYLQRVTAALPGITRLGAAAEELPSLIADSVRIKADVVSRDRKESGLRQTLNFGHTIAHAIELLSDYRVSHGDAVAVGMVIEARIAELVGLASTGLCEVVRQTVREAGLPDSVQALADQVPQLRGTAASSIVELTRSDKKSRSGSVRYALPWQIGEMESADGAWSVAVTDGIVERAIS